MVVRRVCPADGNIAFMHRRISRYALAAAVHTVEVNADRHLDIDHWLY
jgi:hypothetical protein